LIETAFEGGRYLFVTRSYMVNVDIDQELLTKTEVHGKLLNQILIG
jgi:hypothetical protein